MVEGTKIIDYIFILKSLVFSKQNIRVFPFKLEICFKYLLLYGIKQAPKSGVSTIEGTQNPRYEPKKLQAGSNEIQRKANWVWKGQQQGMGICSHDPTLIETQTPSTKGEMLRQC